MEGHIWGEPAQQFASVAWAQQAGSSCSSLGAMVQRQAYTGHCVPLEHIPEVCKVPSRYQTCEKPLQATCIPLASRDRCCMCSCLSAGCLLLTSCCLMPLCVQVAKESVERRPPGPQRVWATAACSLWAASGAAYSSAGLTPLQWPLQALCSRVASLLALWLTAVVAGCPQVF